jgi:putative tricarboxylic transport membrane protein
MSEPNGLATHDEHRRRPDRAALIIAAGLIILGCIVGWDASRIGGGGAYARIGPQTIPFVIAICLLGLGVWTAFEAWRGDFPEREHQEVRPVLWIVAGLLVQLLLIRVVGFSIATGLLFALVARGFGERRLWLSIPFGILFAGLVWFVFARGLQLTLPAGTPEQALIALQQLVFGGTR